MADVKQVTTADVSSRSSGINSDSEKGAGDAQIENVHPTEKGAVIHDDSQSHEQDPKVFTTTLRDQDIADISFSDVVQEDHGLSRNGVSLDWLTSTSIFAWWHPTSYLL